MLCSLCCGVHAPPFLGWPKKLSVDTGLNTDTRVFLTEMNLSRLMDYLQETVDHRLRAVGYQDGEDVGVEYVRPDVESRHTKQQVDRLKELVAGDLAPERFEEIYGMDGLEYVVQKYRRSGSSYLHRGRRAPGVGRQRRRRTAIPLRQRMHH